LTLFYHKKILIISVGYCDLSGYAVANPTYAMAIAKSVNRKMKDADFFK